MKASDGYEPKKSNVLTREETLKFLQEAPNKTCQKVKIVLMFGVFGRWRRQELVNMLIDHVEDGGSVVIVTRSQTKTDKKRVFTNIEKKILLEL